MHGFGGGKKCRAGDTAVFPKPVSVYQNIYVRKKKYKKDEMFLKVFLSKTFLFFANCHFAISSSII